jgi:hypothetical protein
MVKPYNLSLRSEPRCEKKCIVYSRAFRHSGRDAGKLDNACQGSGWQSRAVCVRRRQTSGESR